MYTIKEFSGSLFNSTADFLCHQVNCLGVMGSGIALQVKKLYPNVYQEYKQYCNNYNNSINLLGKTLIVAINENQSIVNLFGQKNFGIEKRQTSYDALVNSLEILKNFTENKTVAFPVNMSCTRGGANWNIVKTIIIETLNNCNLEFWEYNNG